MVHGLKKSGQFAIDPDRDLVLHPGRVVDGVEPVVLGHLLLGEVSSRHATQGLAVPLYETVGGLATSGGTKNL